jgi:hypothetical protein
MKFSQEHSLAMLATTGMCAIITVLAVIDLGADEGPFRRPVSY